MYANLPNCEMRLRSTRAAGRTTSKAPLDTRTASRTCQSLWRCRHEQVVAAKVFYGRGEQRSSAQQWISEDDAVSLAANAMSVDGKAQSALMSGCNQALAAVTPLLAAGLCKALNIDALEGLDNSDVVLAVCDAYLWLLAANHLLEYVAAKVESLTLAATVDRMHVQLFTDALSKLYTRNQPAAPIKTVSYNVMRALQQDAVNAGLRAQAAAGVGTAALMCYGYTLLPSEISAAFTSAWDVVHSNDVMATAFTLAVGTGLWRVWGMFANMEHNEFVTKLEQQRPGAAEWVQQVLERPEAEEDLQPMLRSTLG